MDILALNKFSLIQRQLKLQSDVTTLAPESEEYIKVQSQIAYITSLLSSMESIDISHFTK
jgi:hypothetical protein